MKFVKLFSTLLFTVSAYFAFLGCMHKQDFQQSSVASSPGIDSSSRQAIVDKARPPGAKEDKGMSAASVSASRSTSPMIPWDAYFYNNRFFSGNAQKLNLSGNTVWGGTFCPEATVVQHYQARNMALDLNWGPSFPPCTAGIGADNFSAVFTKQLYFPTSMDATFSGQSDDGARIHIYQWNGSAYIFRKTLWEENFGDHGVQPPLGETNFFFDGGYWYYIMVEYYENTGGAALAVNITPTIPSPQGITWDVELYNFDQQFMKTVQYVGLNNGFRLNSSQFGGVPFYATYSDGLNPANFHVRLLARSIDFPKDKIHFHINKIPKNLGRVEVYYNHQHDKPIDITKDFDVKNGGDLTIDWYGQTQDGTTPSLDFTWSPACNNRDKDIWIGEGKTGGGFISGWMEAYYCDLGSKTWVQIGNSWGPGDWAEKRTVPYKCDWNEQGTSYYFVNKNRSDGQQISKCFTMKENGITKQIDLLDANDSCTNFQTACPRP